MSHSKTDFMFGESRIARVELEQAAQQELPEELQRYGATDVVVIYAVAYFDNPASEDVGGVYGTNTFVIDDDGHPVGSLDRNARLQFDLPEPDEQGWDEWAERLDTSSVAVDLRTCVR